MKAHQAAPRENQAAANDEIWARIGISLIAVAILVEAVKAAAEYFA